jgi:hypothetical protein
MVMTVLKFLGERMRLFPADNIAGAAFIEHEVYIKIAGKTSA